MELKDVVKDVYANAAEAHAAFHAGHHEDSERYLMSVMLQVGKYLDEKKLTPAEVAEQVTSSMGDEHQKETLVEDPGSSESAAKPAAQFLGENVGQVVQSEKPNQ